MLLFRSASSARSVTVACTWPLSLKYLCETCPSGGGQRELQHLLPGPAQPSLRRQQRQANARLGHGDRPRGTHGARLVTGRSERDAFLCEDTLRRSCCHGEPGRPLVRREEEIRGTRLVAAVAVRRMGADQDVGPLVAVDVACGSDRPAGEVVGHLAVDSRAGATESTEVDGPSVLLAVHDVGGARVLAPVVVGLLGAHQQVGAAVEVDVSKSRDRRTRQIARPRAVDPEAPVPERREVDGRRRRLAEHDEGGSRVFTLPGVVEGEADDHVCAAVSVHVTGARDGPADASEHDVAVGRPVDPEARSTWRREIYRRRRCLAEDHVGGAREEAAVRVGPRRADHDVRPLVAVHVTGPGDGPACALARVGSIQP